jgi:transglutaminase-like putative cysteine protease
MQVFKVSHLTRYRYARPVRFGEHRMMLRPRDDADQQLLAQTLTIAPDPDALETFRDAHGNWVAVARFAEAATELVFRNELEVARAPAAQTDPPPPGRRRPLPGADPLVTAWAREALAAAGWSGREPPDAETLERLCRIIHRRLDYRRRLEPGVQPALRTLELGSGACRDFAQLMLTAARGFGLHARFASGYVHTPEPEDPAASPGGHTHAWARILTPDQGWIDFDPTSGLAGPQGLIRLALAEDPGETAPISGVWFGASADFLGMDVQVDVRPSAEARFPPPPDEPSQAPGVA